MEVSSASTTVRHSCWDVLLTEEMCLEYKSDAKIQIIMMIAAKRYSECFLSGGVFSNFFGFFISNQNKKSYLLGLVVVNA